MGLLVQGSDRWSVTTGADASGAWVIFESRDMRIQLTTPSEDGSLTAFIEALRDAAVELETVRDALRDDVRATL